MNEQQQPGVAAPAAPQTVQPVAQPEAQPIQQPQGFGGGSVPNGFSTPQPVPTVAEPAPAAQPLVTDNARTQEQFGKLTENNQRLAEQNRLRDQENELLRQQLLELQRQRQQSQQQFAPVQQVQPVPQGQQQSALPKLEDYVEIDPRNGERFVNEVKFNAAMADIYQTASRAEEVVKNYVQSAEQREIERQEREAFQSFPELDPRGGKFDQRLSQQTRAIIYDSMINPHEYGGRPLSFKDAAEFVTQGRPVPQAQQVVPTPTANVENQVQKEQATVSTQNVPQQVQGNIDEDREFNRLVQGTRLGSDEAIAVRLLNAAHKIEDVEKQA